MDAAKTVFPAGLRVLVVDDDSTSLQVLETTLKSFHYEVTKCTSAEKASSLLLENRNGYDVVISEVHMPGMDGFELLKHVLVKMQMDIPVILMSVDDAPDVVMKGVKHGACDYLIKPVNSEVLKTIWQHVVRKQKDEGRESKKLRSGEDVENRKAKETKDANYSLSVTEEALDVISDTSIMKKHHLRWCPELHERFLAAVNSLGVNKASPKKILELMKVPWLTRDQVGSHLQKYRLNLKKMNEGVVTQNPGVVNNDLMGRQDREASVDTFSLIGSKRNAMAAGMDMPGIIHRNYFSFEDLERRSGERQQLQQMINRQRGKLLNRVLTNMESNKLPNLCNVEHSIGYMEMHPNSHGYGGSLMMQMLHPQTRSPCLNDVASRGGFYHVSQSSPFSKFSNNLEVPGNHLSLVCAPGITAAKGMMLLEQINSKVKGPVVYGSQINTFKQIQQSNSRQPSNLHSNSDVIPSVKIQQQNSPVGKTHDDASTPLTCSDTENTTDQMLNDNSEMIIGDGISDYNLEELLSPIISQLSGNNEQAADDFIFHAFDFDTLDFDVSDIPK